MYSLRSLLTLLALGAFVFGAGCKDEIAAPSQGILEIRLSDTTAGAFAGGTLRITTASGEQTFDDLKDARHTLVFDAGTAVSVEFEKDCATVSPDPVFQTVIEAGRTEVLDWAVSIEGGLTVDSWPQGAQVFLDGVDTGKTTPTTLECVSAGDREVTVSLFGTAGDVSEQVTMTPDGADVSLTMEVSAQSRGAIVELLTATECPNCYPVDVAAENIWSEEDLIAAGAVTVELHHPWAGESDPYFTQDTWDRNSLYDAGDGSAGHPIRVVNGLDRIQGAGNGDIDAITQSMREELSVYLGGSSDFALYWQELERLEGQEVSGTLRVFALSDVADPERTVITAMNYKHDLVTFVRIHRQNETFWRVVRNIETAGTCADFGLVEAGDWADIEFVFDTSWDTEWSEEGMGLVAVVQSIPAQDGSGSKEIHQVAHTALP